MCQSLSTHVESLRDEIYRIGKKGLNHRRREVWNRTKLRCEGCQHYKFSDKNSIESVTTNQGSINDEMYRELRRKKKL